MPLAANIVLFALAPVHGTGGQQLDLALLQLSDVSGKPLAEQTESGTGLPVLTLWPRCLREGWSTDLDLAADHPRGLPIPAEAAGPLLADLARLEDLHRVVHRPPHAGVVRGENAALL